MKSYGVSVANESTHSVNKMQMKRSVPAAKREIDGRPSDEPEKPMGRKKAKKKRMAAMMEKARK